MVWAISLWETTHFRFWLFPLWILILFAPPLLLVMSVARRSLKNHPTAFVFTYVILVQVSRLLLPFDQTRTVNVFLFVGALVITFSSLLIWQWARWEKEIATLLDELGQFLPKNALKKNTKHLVLEGRSIRVLLVLAALALTAVFLIIDIAFLLEPSKLGDLAAIITIPLTLSVAGTIPFYLEIGKRINDKSDKTDEDLMGLRNALVEFDRSCEPLWQFYKSSIGSEWAPLFQQWLYESELGASSPSIRDTLQMEIEVLAQSLMIRAELSQPSDIKTIAISERDIDTLSYLLAADKVTGDLESQQNSLEGTIVFVEPNKTDFENLLASDSTVTKNSDMNLIARRLGTWLDNHTLCRLEAEDAQETYPKQKSTRIRLASDLRTSKTVKDQNRNSLTAQFTEVSYKWFQDVSRHANVHNCVACRRIYSAFLSLVSLDSEETGEERKRLQDRYRNHLLAQGTRENREVRLPTMSQLDRIAEAVSDLSGQSRIELTDSDSMSLISEKSESSNTLTYFVVRAMSWGALNKVEFNSSVLLKVLNETNELGKVSVAKELYIKGVKLHLRGSGSSADAEKLCGEIQNFYVKKPHKLLAVFSKAAKDDVNMASLNERLNMSLDRLIDGVDRSSSPSRTNVEIDEVNQFRKAWNSHIDKFLKYSEEIRNAEYHAWLSPTDEEIHWIVLEELLKRSIKSSSEIALLFHQEFDPVLFARRCALGTKKHISDIDGKIDDVKDQCDKLGLNVYAFIEDAELMKDLFSRYAQKENDLDDIRSRKMLARNIVYALAFNFMSNSSPTLIPVRFRSLLRHLDIHNSVEQFQISHESFDQHSEGSEKSARLYNNAPSKQSNRIPQGHGAFPLRKFWGNLKSVLDYHLLHHQRKSAYIMFSEDSSLEAMAFELSHNRGALQNWVRASNAVNRRHTYLHTAGVLESLVGRTRGRSMLQLPIRISPESVREIIAFTCETPSNSYELQRRLNEIIYDEDVDVNDKSKSKKERNARIEKNQRRVEKNKRRAQDSSVPLRLSVTPLTSIQLRNVESMFNFSNEDDSTEVNS
jgi:hypothetical protein